jgi:hypothetical protein
MARRGTESRRATCTRRRLHNGAGGIVAPELLRRLRACASRAALPSRPAASRRLPNRPRHISASSAPRCARSVPTSGSPSDPDADRLGLGRRNRHGAVGGYTLALAATPARQHTGAVVVNLSTTSALTTTSAGATACRCPGRRWAKVNVRGAACSSRRRDRWRGQRRRHVAGAHAAAMPWWAWP